MEIFRFIPSLSFSFKEIKFIPHLNLDVISKFLLYSPVYKINVETPQYQLKTADSISELIEVFKLRYRVFLGDNAFEPEEKVDQDQYDKISDHIIIKDRTTKQIVGTYRIICSKQSDKFYTQSEFRLDEFLQEKDIKLELGRACVHHGHRNGAVIDLLWRGIAKYVELTNARFLFGCSSIKTESTEVAYSITQFLKTEGIHFDHYKIRPHKKFLINYSQISQSEFLNKEQIKKLFPSLLRSYISAGAKVYGLPALDKEFKCIDYVTIHDLKNLNPSYHRRYFRK